MTYCLVNLHSLNTKQNQQFPLKTNRFCCNHMFRVWLFSEVWWHWERVDPVDESSEWELLSNYTLMMGFLVGWSHFSFPYKGQALPRYKWRGFSLICLLSYLWFQLSCVAQRLIIITSKTLFPRQYGSFGQCFQMFVLKVVQFCMCKPTKMWLYKKPNLLRYKDFEVGCTVLCCGWLGLLVIYQDCVCSVSHSLFYRRM